MGPRKRLIGSLYIYIEFLFSGLRLASSCLSLASFWLILAPSWLILASSWLILAHFGDPWRPLGDLLGNSWGGPLYYPLGDPLRGPCGGFSKNGGFCNFANYFVEPNHLPLWPLQQDSWWNLVVEVKSEDEWVSQNNSQNCQGPPKGGPLTAPRGSHLGGPWQFCKLFCETQSSPILTSTTRFMMKSWCGGQKWGWIGFSK